MANAINLRDLITQQAQKQGVDPAIALAVAQTESGTNQWTAGGNVVTSSAGARGVFQLEPSSFPGQNIDDLDTNIQLGIGYLKQLYAKYGDWSTALAAYNFGPGNVDAGKSWPAETVNYVKAILGVGATYATALAQIAQNAVSSVSGGISAGDIEDSITGISPGMIALGAAAVVGLYWYLSD
jgi:soluble lytic murein transglycosylase-like protein